MRSCYAIVRHPALWCDLWPEKEQVGKEAMQVVVYDFFQRKVRIIVLTLLTYAALC